MNKNNKFKISAPSWNAEFELPDGSCSIRYSNHFEYIIKKHTFTDNPSIMIYVNKIEKRIMFKIETVYHFELLRSEKKKLLGSSKSKITKGENGENEYHLRIAEVVIIHCNTVKNF